MGDAPASPSLFFRTDTRSPSQHEPVASADGSAVAVRDNSAAATRLRPRPRPAVVPRRAYTSSRQSAWHRQWTPPPPRVNIDMSGSKTSNPKARIRAFKILRPAHRKHAVVAERHEVDTEVLGFRIADLHELEAAPAKQRYQPVFQRVDAGHEQLRRKRHHQAIHVHEFPRDGRHHCLHPCSRTHAATCSEPSRSERSPLWPINTKPDSQDVEVAALEVTGSGVAPDRDVVVLIESGSRSRSRRAGS